MPRSTAQNQELREQSRARIIEYALALFSEHGYDRTTIRMIAESAGISQGLIYRYFESKGALLQSIFAQSMNDVRASFAAAESAGSGGERIAVLIRASFEILKGNAQFWRLSYGVRMQAAVLEGLGPATQEWMREIHGTISGFFEDAGAGNPGLQAALLFATIDGVSQHYVLDPANYPLDAAIEEMIRQYAFVTPKSRSRPIALDPTRRRRV